MADELDKKDVLYLYNEILVSHKKEWNNAICSNRGGPTDYHIKWSSSDSERLTSNNLNVNLKSHKLF